MTGQQIYDNVVAELSTIPGYPMPLSPNHFVRLLNAVMQEVHAQASIYHRRVVLTLEANKRYQDWPGGEPEPLAFLKASYMVRHLRILYPMQYPGTVDTDENYSEDASEPKAIWIERDPVSDKVLLGVEPVPDDTYKIHATVKLPLPAYTLWASELPTVIESHSVIRDGILSKLYSLGKSFHENTQKALLFQQYQAGIVMLRQLEQRLVAAPPINTTSDVYEQMGF